MCGILGAINFDFGQSELDLISHRGPDSQGFVEFKLGEHSLKLGHKRLAILDLSSAGHQPMVSNCGKFAIVFNGEVYNHLELRDLLLKDIQFSSTSDTETILYLLREYGIDVVNKFNGIFSFAFINIENKEVFVVRDPFGVKPLYYNTGPNSFIFSSEIRPICSLVSNSLSQDNIPYLSQALQFRYNPSPYTWRSFVSKLIPGHYLKIDLAKKNIDVQIFFWTKPRKSSAEGSKNQLIFEYGEILRKAVKRQLLSDVEVGVFLSGGIDSAVIARLAREELGKSFKSFTVGFEGTEAANEIDEAAETAFCLGIEHHSVKITFSDFLSSIRKCVNIVEEPLGTTSIVPMYHLSRLASNYVKVVLTGQGADETLGGYNRYNLELLQGKVPARFKKILSHASTYFKNETISRGLASLSYSNDIDRFKRAYEIFSNEEIFQLMGHSVKSEAKPIKYLYDLLECENLKYSAERMMAIDARLNLSDDLLLYTDKVTMNFSIECRVPMLDHDLVEFIESLPLKFRKNFFENKIVHREFARQILPKHLLSRPKKGFMSPTATWFRRYREEVESILFSSESDFLKMFKQNEVLNVLDKHSNGHNMEKHIFLLLSIRYLLSSK